MTFPEALVVIGLAAVLVLVAVLSVYRGQETAEDLACQDNMSAIHHALQIYWTKNSRTYPSDQAAFEQFLQNPIYFTEEPRCPSDRDHTLHYLYTYDPANPSQEGITITCPVPGSGHGAL